MKKLYIIDYYYFETDFDWFWAESEDEAVTLLKKERECEDLEINNIYVVDEAYHFDDIVLKKDLDVDQFNKINLKNI